MRLFKHILFGLMLLTILSASAGIAPQKANKQFATHGKIMSKDMIIDRTKMKNFRFSSDGITDRRERDAMRKSMRTNTASKSAANSPQKEGEKLYTVKCVFKGEDVPYFAIYNPELFIEKTAERDNTYCFQVPAGIYDLSAQYYSNVEGMMGNAYIIHENVRVDSDTEIVFTEDELTEKVVIKPLLRDRSEAILPLLIPLPDEPWYEMDYTGVNIDFSHLRAVLFREGCEILAAVTDVAECRVKGYNEETVFLSNKLSDKYHFVFQYFLEDVNGEIQITTTDMIGSQSGIINNYVNDWIKYDVPTFSKTPLYNEFGIEKYQLSVQGRLWINNIEQGGGGLYLENNNPNIYCAVQPSVKGDDVNVKAPVIVKSIQGEKTITYEEDWGDGEIVESSETYRAEMISLPALYVDDQWEYINQNHSECHSFAYQKPEHGLIVEYPGVPAYCYFADEITQPIGNSSPVGVLMTQVNEYPDATILFIELQTYIGRYGEVRNCDMWTLHTEVNLNGHPVYDSESGESLEDWCIDNSLDGHEKGLIEATFTNRNVLVDETIPGFNITTMKVDERNEDLCTPTTKMLIFKNTDGVITDRFSNGEEGLIEFSAGDFNWVNEGAFYTCEEADVKVEYAPYGEDSFMPLEVEEVPENYYMPGFGYFYRGSLADVTMPSTNGWYDVRFTLTDKAGNEMVQHISPAFKIDKNTSVGEEAIDGIKVWSIDGNILAAGSDIESIALYSADGKLIASANGTSLPTNGYRGMGIVKVTATNGITTHKTVIR